MRNSDIRIEVPSGIRDGAMKLLTIMAGIAESIPAINQDSASLLLVSIPSASLEWDHQARTGMENPSNQAGTIMRNEIVSTTSSATSERSATDSPMEIDIRPANRIQTVRLGGVSREESSRIRWCANLVGTGVRSVVPSGSAWKISPSLAGTAIRTCATRGLVMASRAATKGSIQAPPTIVSQPSASASPNQMITEQFAKRKVIMTTPNMCL